MASNNLTAIPLMQQAMYTRLPPLDFHCLKILMIDLIYKVEVLEEPVLPVSPHTLTLPSYITLLRYMLGPQPH